MGIHALVVPLPAQGHVMPLMKFSHKLVSYGIRVTFVNTETKHKMIMAGFEKEGGNHDGLRLVSIPDGSRYYNQGSTEIEDLIKKYNKEDEINLVIADLTIGWVLEIAEKMGIKRAGFWPASAGLLSSTLQFPKLIEAGVIDETGTLIQHSMNLPDISIVDFWWHTTNDQSIQKSLVEMVKTIIEALKYTDYGILCNSIYELETKACDFINGVLPIGPLLKTTQNLIGQPAGQFWQEDSSCLTWLDEQPVQSVIYVAFGSSTVLNLKQFDELVLALELLERPFLLVVRPNLINGVDTEFFDGLRKRKINDYGKIVTWAPQEKVLGHSSIACFLSHCGWNSTMEGLSSGVPFLCWPYIADQFKNQIEICDVWKIGLKLNRDENEFISRDEIKGKVEKMFCDGSFKIRALEFKEMGRMSINEGGSSWKNLHDFFEQIKE